MAVARAALFLVVALTFSRPAAAGPCDTLVSDVLQSTGAQFVRFSPSGQNAFLKHPHMDILTLDCSIASRPLVHGYWTRNASPPDEFFSAVAAAGERVTSEKAGRIETGLRQCNRRALGKPAEEMASADVGAAHIECHSFARDGGSVGLSISKRR